MLKYLICISLFLSLGASAQGLENPQGLAEGSKAPLGELINQNGETVSLDAALKEGPILLLFYRGEWCPYCNRHMALIEEIRDSLNALGVQIFAISPELPEHLTEIQSKTGAEFQFLYDAQYRLIQAYDLAFLPSKATRFKYKSVLGADLGERHRDTREWLPVPASYLIDENGIIQWRHFDPDYTQRSEPEEILLAAQGLRNS